MTDLVAPLVEAAQGKASERSVRAEAAAFAAAILNASKPPRIDAWTEAFGGSAGSFGVAAGTGAPWRDRPTPLLSELVAADPDAARAYAQGLAELAAWAASRGSPDLARINAAGFAAAAQLRAAGARPLIPAVDGPSVMSALTNLTTGPLLRNDALIGPLVGGLPDAGVAPDGGANAGAVQGETTAQAAAEAKPEPPPKTIEELLAELDGLVGLADVKGEVKRQAEVLRVQGLRAKAGLKNASITRHMVFTGGPGTGKTTVARLVSGIYRAYGLLSKGQLVECDRSELVAGYVGQTALKTSEVVKAALGGVLFIDEAYALAGDDFGQEAIDTLVKEMDDHRDDLVVIAAGYDDEMATFIDTNPGLRSRFRLTFRFADYSDDELVQIFERTCSQADFTPTDDSLQLLRTQLAATPRVKGFGNGRHIRNLFDAAVVRQAWRLREVEAPTIDELRTLTVDDLAAPTPPV